jgi:COP9 signalosome complex subunit 5
LYNLDLNESKAFINSKTWKTDPNHFTHVRISAVALLKMVMHARSGGELEVMGLMIGVPQGDTFIVTDAFRLPVEGTETRVNAQAEADEYMVNYTEKLRESGRLENPIGWYHSHPGYGCWLSGIDVDTQKLQQTINDPFLAVVIDPVRTMSDGKVEIGAFRTFPPDYKPKTSGDSRGDQMIPQEKATDFGAHADKYYSLEVSYFKSTLDTLLLSNLWNKYWVGTLSSNALLDNRDYGTKQIKTLAAKINEAKKAADKPRSLQSRPYDPDPVMENLANASRKVENHQRAGLVGGLVKDQIFPGPKAS